MIVADPALAARLEALVVSEMERFTRRAVEVFPESRARCLPIGEGIACFGAEEIPFNEATGLGVTRPVTGAELDTLEAFYHDFQATAEVLVCSLGDAGLAPALARRGWVPNGFEDVFVMDLSEPAAREIAPDPVVDIRIAGAGERSHWGRCVAVGFSDTGEPTPSEYRFGEIVATREGATLLWAWVDGVPVATAELQLEGDVAWLSADTTLPDYRGRGLQRALQAARIELAREAGCALAVSEANPGGSSHRNMQRTGFRLAYTHLGMERAFADAPEQAPAEQAPEESAVEAGVS